jgi:tetratricopeptide (TPR) repeat protein
MRSVAAVILLVAAGTAAAEDKQKFAVLLEQGQQLAAQGKLAEAIAAYEQALAVIPDEPRALAERGLVELRQKDYKRADATMRMAIAHATDPAIRGGALYNLGLVQEAQGDKAAAKVSYVESLRTRPSHVVRGRLAALDRALAMTFDPFAPKKLAGPFGSIEGLCAATVTPEMPADCSCDEMTKLGGKKVSGAFAEVQLFQRKCAGTELDIAFRTTAGWWSTTVSTAAPNSSPFHCGHTVFTLGSVVPHGGALAVEYTTSGSCFHRASEWGWEERAFVLAGVGKSTMPSATPAVTLKLLGTDGNTASPKYDKEPTFALQISWGKDGSFDLAGTARLLNAEGTGKFEADALLGHHDLLFP